MRAAALLLLGSGLVLAGARALYVDVRFVQGTGTCNTYLTRDAAPPYLQLHDCEADYEGLLRIAEPPGTPATYLLPLRTVDGPPAPTRLFVHLRDQAVVRVLEDAVARGEDPGQALARRTGAGLWGSDGLKGRTRSGPDALRLAVARTEADLAFGWLILEQRPRPSRSLGATTLLLGLLVVAVPRRRRRSSRRQAAHEDASSEGAADPNIPAAEYPRDPAPEREDAEAPYRQVDVGALAGAHRRYHVAKWLLLPFALAFVEVPFVAVNHLLPTGGSQSVELVAFLLYIGLAVAGVIALGRLGIRMSGATARRAAGLAWTAAAVLVGVAVIAWGWLDHTGLALAAGGLTLIVLNIGVAAQAVHRLNGYTEPILRLRDAALLKPMGGGRPGLFASGRYFAVIFWLIMAGLGRIFGVLVAMLIAALNYVSPVDLIHALYPRVVRPLLARASGAGLRRRRYGSPSARALMERDARPPILLLRSFLDDDLAGREERAWHRSADTFEEVVTDRLWTIGPVIAIGQPGEPLPRAGAAREYVSHDGWQDRVHELARGAGVIAIIAGATPGIAWELANVARMGVLDRTILVFPPLAQEELQTRYRALYASCSEELGSRLPTVLPPRTLAVVFGCDPPVALVAPRRSARYYEEAIAVAARAALTAGTESRQRRPLTPAGAIVPDGLRARASATP